MSIALMTVAWKSTYASGKKMVLLALCDNANDQGECFPSISMLAQKCSMSERSVFNHVASLEDDGAIHRENRPGRSTVYHLDPCKFCIPTPADSAPLPLQILQGTPATVAPPPLQILHPTPATVSPTPATVAPITIKEPSGNHQGTKDKTVADALHIPGVADSLLADYLVVRKAKKAGALTATAIAGLQREAEKAGLTLAEAITVCCERGWQGFTASWYVDQPKASTAKPAAPGKHTGFKNLNYRDGITQDGSFA